MKEEYNNVDEFVEDIEKENLKDRLIHNKNFYIIKPTESDLKRVEILYVAKTNPGNYCGICNTQFFYGWKYSFDCCACKLYIVCRICNKVFLFYHSVHYSKGFIYSSIKKGTDIKLFCSLKCSRINVDTDPKTQKIRSDVMRKR